MQTSMEKQHSPDEELLYSEAVMKITEGFYTGLQFDRDSEDFDDEEQQEDEEGGDEEGEFSFVCEEANTSQIAAEDAFVNGQIKPVFPLFGKNLLFPDEDSKISYEDLPVKPPVKKVFVETKDWDVQVTSASSENGDIAGPYCEWSSRKVVEASPEVCKKSNSTGLSKIWRLKEFTGTRCNSDGRDAFVFLNKRDMPPSTADPAAERVEKEVKGGGPKVKKSGKSKTASLSAHEVYLKSKAKAADRRRSYLPYRPELMGIFTNVNSGLTRNVHPY